jgi:hypothetical protein
MRKTLKYAGIILLLLVIPVSFAFIPIGNNIILQLHKNELKSLKLNAEYDILAADSKCGKFIGCGNGMQYFSALLIHSKEKLKLENDDLEGVFLIDILDTSFADFINDYGNYCNKIKNKLKEVKDPVYYYVVYSFYNAPLDSIWNIDLRAH